MARKARAKAKKKIKKVSVSLIKAIFKNKLGGAAEAARQAIFVLNPTLFKGTKPFTYDEMGDVITAFDEARPKYKQGGLAAKLPYKDALAAIINSLLLLAPYVDEIALGDETTLKLSTLPYTGMVNNSGELIKNGAVATELTYKPRATGVVTTSCAAFGLEVSFIAILVRGKPFPEGTYMDLNGQIILPEGDDAAPYILNVNGKRKKTFTNLIPRTNYYLYYVMIAGGVVSALSEYIIIVAGN